MKHYEDKLKKLQKKSIIDPPEAMNILNSASAMNALHENGYDAYQYENYTSAAMQKPFAKLKADMFPPLTEFTPEDAGMKNERYQENAKTVQTKQEERERNIL